MSDPTVKSTSTRQVRSSQIRDWIVSEISKALNVDPSTIDASAPLDSLGVDSLNAIGLAGSLAEWLGRDLPASLMWDYASINAIAQGLADRPSEPAQASWPGVVNLQPRGSQMPIFFFPGRGGHPVTFFPLAEQLGTDQPSYGLTLPGLEQNEKPLESVEEIALALIKTVQQIQPNGPYRLAGYSLGGMIAYEVARQLVASGHKVQFLAIYDVSVPGGMVPRPRWQRLLVHLYLLTTRPNRIKYLADRIKPIRRGRTQEDVEPSNPPDGLGAQEAHYKRFSIFNNEIASRFMPKPYSGPVVLFRSSVPSPYEIFFKVDPMLGWGAFTEGRVRVIHLPGSHGTILSPENAPNAAQLLRPILAGAAAS